MKVEEILQDYPQLKKEDILEAIKYANKVLKREEIFPISKNAA